jgi:hypothetical protein
MVNYKILDKKITEHYRVEFSDLIEDGEPVVVQLPIFNMVGDEDYLQKSIENRYISEKNRLEQ